MCGILGLISKSYDKDCFISNLNRLAHRGPDGFGVWEDNGCILGHRRLSIIDISDNGKQPMEVVDRYVITFNGEVFNYLEIKRELESTGIKFKSKSDTEVLLYAYLQWGIDCLSKLNGMWSFAIWDKVLRVLFLARDRVGEKPLFYLDQPERFVFSSEMKSLYNYCQDFQLNNEVVGLVKDNVFKYESTNQCLVKEINRFPAGSYGFYRAPQQRSTHCPTLPSTPLFLFLLSIFHSGLSRTCDRIEHSQPHQRLSWT